MAPETLDQSKKEEVETPVAPFDGSNRLGGDNNADSVVKLLMLE